MKKNLVFHSDVSLYNDYVAEKFGNILNAVLRTVSYDEFINELFYLLDSDYYKGYFKINYNKAKNLLSISQVSDSKGVHSKVVFTYQY